MWCSIKKLTGLQNHSGWSLWLKANESITFFESKEQSALQNVRNSYTKACFIHMQETLMQQVAYPCTLVKPPIHCFNVFSAFCWSVNRMVDMLTRCFSRRFIKGIGNLSYTLSFSAMRMSLDNEWELYMTITSTVNNCKECIHYKEYLHGDLDKCTLTYVVWMLVVEESHTVN